MPSSTSAGRGEKLERNLGAVEGRAAAPAPERRAVPVRNAAGVIERLNREIESVDPQILEAVQRDRDLADWVDRYLVDVLRGVLVDLAAPHAVAGRLAAALVDLVDGVLARSEREDRFRHLHAHRVDFHRGNDERRKHADDD